ncbi:hypothetical protein [Streptomyces sp. NPDC058086]|uniref:hypothetical protein n=1 Tax=Streptomyces sp. NPDC058086 TaxID=3346334 RepID=UPI0036E680AA
MPVTTTKDRAVAQVRADPAARPASVTDPVVRPAQFGPPAVVRPDTHPGMG